MTPQPSSQVRRQGENALISTKYVSTYKDGHDIWMDIVARSSHAWYRHSYNLADFHRAVAIEKNLVDESVFVIENDKIIGLIPALIMDGDNNTRELSYNGGPTPWPCFLAEKAKTISSYEQYAFGHLMGVCRRHKVDRCVVGLNAPGLTEIDQRASFNKIVNDFRLLDISFRSHLVPVDEDSPARMRASYRKNVRKFSKKHVAQVYTGRSVTAEIEDAYFKLHVKDAGGQFRSRDSYTKMADLARKGEAAFIVATEKLTNKIVGILIIATFKNAAYDSSVSIDPDYHQDYISHILKAEALGYLSSQKISHYELGQVYDTAQIGHIPTTKERNITFFKDGFSRGVDKTSFVAERYFNLDAINKKTQMIHDNLALYFECSKN